MQNNHLYQKTKLLSLIKIFHWAQRCAQLDMLFQQNRSSRELPLYNARSFITLPNAEPRPPA